MLYLPLAIMGVRGRVRRQSVVRARSTKVLPVLPELRVTTAFPSRWWAPAAGSGEL